MAISEAARADLYHGLSEVLGDQRAETLMSVLPSYELPDLATKGDIALLSARIDALEVSLGGRIGRLEERMDRLEDRMDRLEDRMDRLEGRLDQFDARMNQFFITLITGMFLIIATLIAGFIAL